VEKRFSEALLAAVLAGAGMGGRREDEVLMMGKPRGLADGRHAAGAHRFFSRRVLLQRSRARGGSHRGHLETGRGRHPRRVTSGRGNDYMKAPVVETFPHRRQTRPPGTTASNRGELHA